MVVAINLPLMFVIAVLRSKDRRTNRTGEMFDVVFTFEGSNVRATKSAAAIETKQVESPKIVDLA